MKITLALTFALVNATLAMASQPQAKDSKHVVLQIEESTEAHQKTLKFKVLPQKGIKLNFDESAAWQLKLGPEAAPYFTKNILKKADVDQTLPGFKITSSTGDKTKPAQIAYELTTFSCTLDATQCFRETIAGQYTWNSKK